MPWAPGPGSRWLLGSVASWLRVGRADGRLLEPRPYGCEYCFGCARTAAWVSQGLCFLAFGGVRNGREELNVKRGCAQVLRGQHVPLAQSASENARTTHARHTPYVILSRVKGKEPTTPPKFYPACASRPQPHASLDFGSGGDHANQYTTLQRHGADGLAAPSSHSVRVRRPKGTMMVHWPVKNSHGVLVVTTEEIGSEVSNIFNFNCRKTILDLQINHKHHRTCVMLCHRKPYIMLDLIKVEIKVNVYNI